MRSAAGRGGVVEIAARQNFVLVQCTSHNTLHAKNSITHALSSTGGHGAWSNLWAYNCLARRCYCKALDTLVLSAAAHGVVEVAARQRCILVQRTIHNNLNSSRIQSLTHSLVS
jgi:hypothetical protein